MCSTCAAVSTDSEVRGAIDALAGRLDALGAPVSRGSDLLLPDLAAQHGIYMALLNAAMSRGSPAGTTMNAHEWMNMLDAQVAFRRRWDAFFQAFDVVVAPTVPVAPPRIAPLVADDDAFARTNALVLRNPSAFNFLDACALSLPCHPRDAAPVGLMLAAAPHADDALLSIGRAVEAVLAPLR